MFLRDGCGVFYVSLPSGLERFEGVFVARLREFVCGLARELGSGFVVAASINVFEEKQEGPSGKAKGPLDGKARPSRPTLEKWMEVVAHG